MLNKRRFLIFVICIIFLSFIVSLYCIKYNNISKEEEIKKIQMEVTKIQKELNSKVIENKKVIKEKEIVIDELSTQSAKLENTVKKLSSVGKKPKNYKTAPTINRGSYDRNRENLEPVGEWLCTFYAPTKEECGNNKGITASGKPVVAGYTIAVDPEYWKLGTKFYIEGYGEVIATDTGVAIKGKNRLDFCVFDENISHCGNFIAKVWIIKD